MINSQQMTQLLLYKNSSRQDLLASALHRPGQTLDICSAQLCNNPNKSGATYSSIQVMWEIQVVYGEVWDWAIAHLSDSLTRYCYTNWGNPKVPITGGKVYFRYGNVPDCPFTSFIINDINRGYSKAFSNIIFPSDPKVGTMLKLILV